jgi:hypothetical protein
LRLKDLGFSWLLSPQAAHFDTVVQKSAATSQDLATASKSLVNQTETLNSVVSELQDVIQGQAA